MDIADQHALALKSLRQRAAIEDLFARVNLRQYLTHDDVDLLIGTTDREVVERYVDMCAMTVDQHRRLLFRLFAKWDAALVHHFIKRHPYEASQSLEDVCTLPTAAPTLASFTDRTTVDYGSGSRISYDLYRTVSPAERLLESTYDVQPLFDKLTRFPDSFPLARSIAASEGATEEMLFHLAQHDDELTRMLAAANPNLPPEAKHLIALDPSPNVRAAHLWGNGREYSVDPEVHAGYTRIMLEPGLHDHLLRALIVGLAPQLYTSMIPTSLFLEVVPLVLGHEDPGPANDLHQAVEAQWELVARHHDTLNVRALFARFGVRLSVLTQEEQEEKARQALRSKANKALRSQQRKSEEPQTPPPAEEGYVYVAMNPAFPSLVKIGQTTRDVDVRMRELSAGTGTPGQYLCIAKKKVPDCVKAEAHMHQHFAHLRSQSNREFFKMEPHVATEYLLSL